MTAQDQLANRVEQRVRRRRRFQEPAMLLALDARCRPVDLMDISEGGLCMRATLPLEVRSTCAIAFASPDESAAKRINAWAKVAYCLQHDEGTYRIGVRFIDCDSYSKMHIGLLCN